MHKFVGVLLALLLGWAVIWTLCLKRKHILPQSVSASAPEVKVQYLKPETVTVTHEYIGHVEAIQSVLIHPYISGFIDKVLVSGGAKVNLGDLLFVLQQDKYLAEVEAAEAKVIGAAADLEKARLYLERIENTSSEAVSKTERDNAQTAFAAAEATLAASKAALKVAQVNYNYTQILAPITGVLGNISVTNGEYVSPEGSALAYILQYNPIRVRFSMPEKDFLNLGADVHFFQTGELKLRLANGQIITANGSVRFADNQVKSGTSSIDLFADFENEKHLLLPGAYVTILYDEKITDTFLIDRSWVSLQPDGAYVYLVKDGTIQLVKVQLGSLVGNRVVVDKGLQTGDLIITTPVVNADVGKKVKILEGAATHDAF